MSDYLKCHWCGSTLAAPRRGKVAETCSDKCRQALRRAKLRPVGKPPRRYVKKP